MNNKGVSEIVSQILLMLVTVVVVGIIIAAIVPQMSRGKSQIKFEESKLLRDNLFSSIQEVYNSPIGYTKEINLALENLTLVIDADTNTIEVYSLIDGDFYKDGLRQEETSEKYTYRRGQKVYAGFTLSNINLLRSYVLENVTRTSIYLRKTDKEKITVLLENVTEDSWFTSSNLGLYTENPSTWLYRKKILIDGNKVDGNLTNFPALIYLNDFDLNLYAKSDGSDIIFTSKDGKTKLKREIESYSPRESYEYRKKITIDKDKVEEDLTDFPMLVSLLDSDLKTYAQSDGRDIYFTASDGETRLKREIESFQDKNLLRKKITIDHTKVDSNLTDFPVLISLEDENLTTYAKADGSDIYFTASDGTTRLKREIESFEDVNTYRKKITIDSNKVDEDLTDFPMLVSLVDSDLKTFAKADGSDIYFTTSDGTRLKREIEKIEDKTTYKKLITIDHTKVDSNLTDFPMLVSLTESNLASFAKEDGSDIYFTASDGETRLKREIEDYNSTTGAIVAWVKVPELSSTTDTNIYMHFGDEDENNSNDLDVWDNNFVNVLHLNGNNTTNLSDSTSNGYAGIKKAIGDPINLFPGKIGGGQDLQSSGSYIIGRNLSTKISTTYTFETWINTNTIDIGSEEISTFGRTIAASSTTLEKPLWVSLRGSEIWVRTFTKNDPIISTTGANITTNHWHHLAITATRSGTTELYIDGNKYGEAPSGTLYSWNTVYTIGDLRPDRLLHFDGKIDEVRLSNSIRSESWIKTEYNNQSSPEDFYTTGELETTTTKELIAWVKIPELSSEIDTNIYMHFGNVSENNTNDTDVWDSNYVGVWHKNDLTTSTIKDSTANNNTGTKVSANNPIETTGKIGKAQNYLGDDYITLGESNKYISSNNQPLTVNLWFNAKTISSDSSIPNRFFSILKDVGTSSFILGVGESNKINFFNGSAVYNFVNTINPDAWYFISAVYDGNSTQLYFNNEKDGTPITHALTVGSTHLANMGASAPRTGFFLNGLTDEIRISNIARSESWIKTEYNNQSSPETFSSIGELETITTKELIAWVKVPELSSTTDTEIYINFGDEDENNSNDTDVWDSNFISVWHKSDFNSTTILDSTFNNITGTKSTSPPLQTIGKIGKAQMYNNQHISLGQNKLAPLLNGTTGITVTAWIKPNSLNTEGWILFEYINAKSVIFTMRTHSDKTFSTSGRSKITDGSQQHYSTATLNENEWQYVVIQADYTNTKQNTYYNGIFDNNSTPIWGNTTLVTGTPSSDARIGNHQTAGRNFDGIIDELRVSKTVRSPSWIKTEYNNQSSPETFSSIGELETITTKELIAWIKIPNLSSTTNTEIYINFGDEDENNSNDTDVWDSNYVGVWHKNDYNSTTILDSTSNNNTGTKVSANNPIETTGKIGKAQNYLGDDYITISSTAIETASFWTNFNSVTDVQYFLGGSSRGIRYTGTDFLAYNGSSGYVALNWTKEDTWKYFTITRVNANDYNIYIDGNYLGITTAGTNGTAIDITLIGKRADGYFFNGPLDEVRISNTSRSESWIKTEYNNQSSPDDFYSVSDIETVTTEYNELFAWVKIPVLSSEEDTAIYMYFGNLDVNENNDKEVWDEDYAVVLHFNNSLLDSTINNINGITTGTITPVKDRFNNLNAFSFASGYVTIPKPFNQNNLEQIWTVDAWYKLKTNNSTQTLLQRNSFNAGCHFIWGATKNPLLYLNVGDHDYYTYGNGNYIKTNVWQKITYVFRNSDTYRKIYVNGTDITTSGPNKTSTPAGITSTINIGDPYTGDLDAVRISKIARSEEWIKTEYNNQSVPEEFIKIGILEKA